MRQSTRMVLATACAGTLSLPLIAAQPGSTTKDGPPQIVSVSAEEKAQLLAAETPAQKALRAELADLAKKGEKIYFNMNLRGNNDIFVVNCDGTDLKALTTDTADDAYPHCSPDGGTIAFVSRRVPLKKPVPDILKAVPVDPKVPLDTRDQKWNRFQAGDVIWLMKSDGSDPRPAAFGSMPHWSPDGKFLAYGVVSRPWPNQLAILNVEKRTEACIQHPGMRNCGMPCFSPDGKFIVGANGAAYCALLNADKTAVEKVFMFDNGHPCNGELSPDGKHWTYVIDTDSNFGGWLCYREMDYEKPSKTGGKQFNLGWAKGTVNYFPCFSPDGKYLVYAHGDQQKGVKSWELRARQELYVTRFPACDATVRITWTGAASQHPHWVNACVRSPLKEQQRS